MICKNIHSLLVYSAFAVFLIVAGLTGCKSTDSVSSSMSAGERSDLEELYWARQDSARDSFTEADVKFMTGMICHHAQALTMSRLAPENGASKPIRTLSARIINAQKDEIRSMQKWLSDRNQPVPKIEFDGLKLKITLAGKSYTKYKKMPGVLAQRKIEELAEAEGSKFDRLFLTYMIEHHRGAVVMVDNLFDTDGAAREESAFRLATNIQVDQRTEIERMRQMLENISESG